ncbi:UNVERIFIED_CONTAM: hypothetical protein B566_EDAN019534, partial [Ephemera danica]
MGKAMLALGAGVECLRMHANRNSTRLSGSGQQSIELLRMNSDVRPRRGRSANCLERRTNNDVESFGQNSANICEHGAFHRSIDKADAADFVKDDLCSKTYTILNSQRQTENLIPGDVAHLVPLVSGGNIPFSCSIPSGSTECGGQCDVIYDGGMIDAPKARHGLGPCIVASGTVAAPPVKNQSVSNFSSKLSASNRLKECELEAEEISIMEQEIKLRKLRLENSRRSLTLQNGDDRLFSNIKDETSIAVPTGKLNPDHLLIKELVSNQSLSKIEIEPFDGSPCDYHNFITDFEENIASYLVSDSQKLSHLRYYCRGQAKVAIRHCGLLPKETRYSQALSILKSTFGRPHDIIQAVTKDLFTGPKLPGGDASGWKRLATQMRECHLTLTQLGHAAFVDSPDHLLRIIERFPHFMQDRWAETAESIIEKDREPSFSDLLKFVEKRASVAGNLYGKFAAKATTNSQQIDYQSQHENPRARVSTLLRPQHNMQLCVDPDLFDKYSAVIESHVSKGYVSGTSLLDTNNRWYLPHHPVLNPHKPGKVRIVFDCAASFQGRSLNGDLLSGPVLMNDLTGVLIRFRRYAVAVGVPVNERRYLSFLWWSNRNMNNLPNVYEHNVHPFGAKSSPFCATFALQKTMEDNRDKYSADCCQAILDNFYVDDCLLSVCNVEEAKRLVNELRDMLMRGGFRLLKWNSNRSDVLCAVPEKDKAMQTGVFELLKVPAQSALGVRWNTESDTLEIILNLPDRPHSRRGILGCVSSLYDPLGFVAPMTLVPRQLLQELCRSGVGWDSILSNTYLGRWLEWLSHITSVKALSIPRCMGISNSDNSAIQLHMFCDASESGYGAVGYLRVINVTGD